MNPIEKSIFFKRAHDGLEPSLRKIAKDEIIIEFDDVIRKEGLKLCSKSLKLLEGYYNVEVWDHLGKSCHLHIKDIEGLNELDDELVRKYKLAFIKIYTNDCKNRDKSLCSKEHLIACENTHHHKIKLENKPYGIKKLIHSQDKHISNVVDQEILRNVKEGEFDKEVNKSSITKEEFKNTLSYKIAKKINITDIAQQFGLTRFNTKLWECPFHNSVNGHDLSLYDEDGLFYCFGCEVSGSIIKFYNMLKKLNPKFKYKQIKDNKQ